MRERYFCMIQLRDHLARLFQLCGLKPERVDILPLPAPLKWLEKLLQDENLYNYLESLDYQTTQAIAVMEDRRLDDWNNRENERRLAEQEHQLEKLENQLTLARGKLAGLENAAAQAKTEAEQLRQIQLETVNSFIALRDNLLMRLDWIRDCAPEETGSQKLVEAQLQETGRMLERMGVTILEDSGDFDSRRHTVVDTRPAQFPEQVDKIAQTFRPGYAYGGKTLRPQEVILYSAVQEDEACP